MTRSLLYRLRWLSIREADGFLHNKQRIADYLKKNEGMACYTHVLGKMITFGRKV